MEYVTLCLSYHEGLSITEGLSALLVLRAPPDDFFMLLLVALPAFFCLSSGSHSGGGAAGRFGRGGGAVSDQLKGAAFPLS